MGVPKGFFPRKLNPTRNPRGACEISSNTFFLGYLTKWHSQLLLLMGPGQMANSECKIASATFPPAHVIFWVWNMCSFGTTSADFSTLHHKLCWPIHQDRSVHTGIYRCRFQSPGSAHVHEAPRKNGHWGHHRDFACLWGILFFFAWPSPMDFSVQNNIGQMLRCSFQVSPLWLSPWTWVDWLQLWLYAHITG